MTVPRLRVLWLLALGVCPVALAGAEVRIVDGNGGGEGLNERTAAAPVGGNPGTSVGEQRLIAAQYAAALWSATLGNQVPIAVHVEFSDLDCSGGSAVLGSSGPCMLYGGDKFPAALANEQAGRDLDPGREEIDARFNSRLGRPDCAVTSWYPGLDNAAPPGSTDLASVFLHELAHGLGFIKSSSSFRNRARDGTSGLLLSQLAGPDYDAAIRRPRTSAKVGPAVRPGRTRPRQHRRVLYLPDGASSGGPGSVSASHGSAWPPCCSPPTRTGATSCCLPARPRQALVLAERLRADGGWSASSPARSMPRRPGRWGFWSARGCRHRATAYRRWTALTIRCGASPTDGAQLERRSPPGPTAVASTAGDGVRAKPRWRRAAPRRAYSEGSAWGTGTRGATRISDGPTINPAAGTWTSPRRRADVGWSPSG
jgi:hypothetical protein